MQSATLACFGTMGMRQAGKKNAKPRPAVLLLYASAPFSERQPGKDNTALACYLGSGLSRTGPSPHMHALMQ